MSILNVMAVWSRVGAGLVLLVTMLVSPMAPVLCALSCPEPDARRHGASVGYDRHVTAPAPSAWCHEDAATAPAGHAPQASAAFVGVAGHRCQHPAIATSAAQSDRLRVPQPIAATTVAPYGSVPENPVRPTPAASPTRRPSARPASGFSLALRI